MMVVAQLSVSVEYVRKSIEMLLCGGCFPDRDMLVVVVEVWERAVQCGLDDRIVFWKI